MPRTAKAAPPTPVPTPAEAARPPAQAAGKAERQWWFDARGLEDGDGGVLDAAYQSGCAVIVLTPEQQKRVRTAKPRAVHVERGEQLNMLAPDAWVLTADEGVLAGARRAGRKAGCFIAVEDLEKEFPRCQRLVRRGYDFVVIDMHHATYIPFELLLAEAAALPTRILRSVPIHGLQGRWTSYKTVQIMADLRATVLLTTPPYAMLLAEVAEQLGRRPVTDLAPRLLWLTGEGCAPAYRRRLEELWRCQGLVFYGSMECGCIGIECPRQAGGHVCMGHLVLEVLDPQTGRPADPGQVGEVVGTVL